MISAIVLAAGMSTRMGKPKALLEWEGVTLGAYQVAQLFEAGVDEVVVVLGYRADDVARSLRRLPCRLMNNAHYVAGRASSLRIGAKAVDRDTEAIIVVNVDQPRTAAFYRTLIATHDPATAGTRPMYEGHSGHPILVSQRLRDELLAVTEEGEGIKAVLRGHNGELGSYESTEECLLDLNTPEEYEAARRAAPAVS